MTDIANGYKGEIRRFFDNFGESIEEKISSLNKGKIYEIYCLCRLLAWIDRRYDVDIKYCNPVGDGIVRLKSGHGKVKRNKYSYFVISPANKKNKDASLEVHMNIEVLTRSEEKVRENRTNSQMLSSEIDIVLIWSECKDNYRPKYTELVLGIECKFHSKFRKRIINEVIGIKKEITREVNERVMFCLDEIFDLNPNRNRRYDYFEPGSEYWLAYILDIHDDIKFRLKENGVKLYKWRQRI